MEHSKVRLLIKDIAGERVVRLEGNKQVVGSNNSDFPSALQDQEDCTHHMSMSAKPTSPLFTITTPHTTITPL